ncbi:MAG: 5'/3'-nucleotidase SurE [Planctomycetota bacterium]|nr:MAG: 5'/3'-nucleotidase SurE [Planctomycetota bacterium]
MKSLHSPFVFGAIALVILISSLCQEPEAPTPTTKPLRILITNDDGVDSAGIAELAKAFSTMGEVTVCAPPANRSGASHSSQLFSGPAELTKGSLEGAKEVWIIDGTPSDCVTFGIVHLGKDRPFDLVVSGINHGNNVGMVAHYSGTVGAAMEGSMHGVLSMAVSQDVPRGTDGDYLLAAKFSVELAHKLRAENAPTHLVYNVNLPTSDRELLKGVASAPMGGIYIKVPRYSINEVDGKSMLQAHPRFNMDHPENSDTALFYQGNITVTALRTNWSDAAMMKTMQGWDLRVSE